MRTQTIWKENWLKAVAKVNKSKAEKNNMNQKKRKIRKQIKKTQKRQRLRTETEEAKISGNYYMVIL